jgi:glucose-6-phosphate 1-dehydrogenase
VLIASGKALDKKETSLRVEFKALSMKALTLVKKQAPHLADKVSSDTPSTLRVVIAPTPKISLEIAGEEIVIVPPGSFDKRTAYHRLLDAAIQGKTELFSSVNDATLMWKTTDAIHDAWKDQSKGLFPYAAGSDLTSPKSF